MKPVLLLLPVLFFTLISTASAEPVPGDSCAAYPEHAVMRSGGPELEGRMFVMVCRAGIWTAGDINPENPCDDPDMLPGTLCFNGMIYAGTFNGNKIYAAGNDASEKLLWGPHAYTSGMAFCTSPYTGGVCDTGRENTQLLVGLPDSYPAAEYCANLNAHGHDTGWYLPSRRELHMVYQNLGPAPAHHFKDGHYWVSVETSTNYAWGLFFTNGSWTQNSRSNAFSVRCLWR